VREVQEVLLSFEKPPAQGRTERLVRFLLEASTDDVETFIREAMRKLPKGGTFLDMAISHASDGALDRIAPLAIEGLEAEAGPSDACEGVLEYISLQRPVALHPHLSRLFELAEYANGRLVHAWREAGPDAIAPLLHQLQAAGDEDRKWRARRCLLELRTPEALRLALTDVPEADRSYHLQSVGYRSETEPLYTDLGTHLIFDPGFLPADRPAWQSYTFHPTWRLDAGAERYRIGGSAGTGCRSCGEQLCHLLTLPRERVFPGTVGVAMIALNLCLSCVDERGPQLYRHGTDGQGCSIGREGEPPDRTWSPILEATVRLADTPARWRWQDWGAANHRENLHRLGGYPAWVQEPEFPACPDCKRSMSFLLQLDSDLPGEGGGFHLWGSGGACYGYRCERCLTTAFTLQCT
jgi:hypothetical protein